MKRIIIIFLFLVLFLACAGEQISKKDSLIQNAEFLFSQGDQYWSKRDKPGNARQAYYFYSKAYSLLPNNQELGIKYAHACYFLGNYVETEPSIKDSLYLEGATVAKGIIIRSQHFNNAPNNLPMDSILAKLNSASSLDQIIVHALYWWGVNYSRFFINKPVVERINQREVVESIMHHVISSDPTYDYGGAYRFFGTLYVRLPGIELSQSKSYFVKSIEAFPNCFASYVLMAEYYYTKAGDRDRFREYLEKVINADPTILPDIMPENLYNQARARALLEKESQLFE